MRVECAWCKRELPKKGDDTDDVTHTICLSCIDDVLTKALIIREGETLFQEGEDELFYTLIQPESGDQQPNNIAH